MYARNSLKRGPVWLLVAALLPAAAFAGFRCDTELVTRGMIPLEVLERCGEPVYEQGWTDFRYPGLFVRVDEWTYEQGRNKFRRQLIFENGRLVRIETRRKPGGPGLESSRQRNSSHRVVPPWAYR